jgi:hypothetical protein
VSRETFAFSRLFGSLAIVVVAGAVLLGGTALLFTTRGDLPLAPALVAGLACLLGCIAISALAMTASLFLPRLATWLLVVGAVALLAIAGGLRLAPVEQQGWLYWLGEFGPPLATSMVGALGPWIEQVEIPIGPYEHLPRLLLWDAMALGALAIAFRRREIAT